MSININQKGFSVNQLDSFLSIYKKEIVPKPMFLKCCIRTISTMILIEFSISNQILSKELT